MPGNNNPITDDTGQQILGAVQALTAAIQANTVQLAALAKVCEDVASTQAAALRDSQHRAMCMQRGQPYTPPA